MLTPIPAASVIVLRDAPVEVLLLRRSDKSSFVPGAWVFPGGAIEANEEMRDAAVRETFEECGIALDPQRSCRPRAGSRRSAFRSDSTPGSSSPESRVTST